MRYLIILACLLGICAAAVAQSLPLVNTGVAQGEIILAANADLRERFAAKELQHWIEQISDVTLPLLALPSEDVNTKLFIGRKWANASYAADITFLGDTEGFAVRHTGANVYIFGAKPAGTLFGTWRFLEANTDIIWSRPNTQYGTVFTPTNTITLTEIDFRDKPVFPFRSWSMPGGVNNDATHLWQDRNGCNGQLPGGMNATNYRDKEMGRTMKQGGGFMYGYLGKYKDTHPEYFPLVDGQRILSNHVQPCFTNAGAMSALIYEARQYLQNAPDETIILDCGNEDTWTCCECPSCLAPIQLPDGTTLAPTSPKADKDPLFRSTQMYMFLNQLAENLAPDYPNVKILTLAYIFAAEPPRVTVNPAVRALFAPYPTVNMRFPLMEHGPGVPGSWATRFDTWRTTHQNLGFYEYYGVGYFNAMAETAAINLQDLANYGGIGMNSEALQDEDVSMDGIGSFKQAWDVNSMDMWVISRLMWNPYQDVAALRQQFISRTYKEAAPQMTQFFATLNQTWHDAANRTFENCHSGRIGVFKRYIVDTGKEKQMRALLLQAQAAAVNPNAWIAVTNVLTQFDGWADGLGRITVPYVADAATEGVNFTSARWGLPMAVNNFKLPHQGSTSTLPTQPTEVKMMHDNTNLYVRIVATDPNVAGAKANPKASGESFPIGDHAEVYLRINSVNYLFAIDFNGNQYEAKNWDRRWNCTWTGLTRTTATSWEAIMVIPLASVGITPALIDPTQPATIPYGMFARFYNHNQALPEESTHNGIVVTGPANSVWSELNML